jgi:hypothetical protein
MFRRRRTRVTEDLVGLRASEMKLGAPFVCRLFSGKPGAGMSEQSLRPRLVRSMGPCNTCDRGGRLEPAGTKLRLGQIDESCDGGISGRRYRANRPQTPIE